MSQLWVTVQMRGNEVEEADLFFPFEAVQSQSNWALPDEYRRAGCQLLVLPLITDERPSFTLEMEVVRE